jgi:hypothetical protein
VELLKIQKALVTNNQTSMFCGSLQQPGQQNNVKCTCMLVEPAGHQPDGTEYQLSTYRKPDYEDQQSWLMTQMHDLNT